MNALNLLPAKSFRGEAAKTAFVFILLAALVLAGSRVWAFPYTTSTSYVAASSGFDVVAGDFDGDGDQDLASVADNGVSKVSVFLNDGSGNFGAKTDFNAGTAPRSIATGQFNPGTDSFLDLVVANFSSNNVSILLGNGDGTFDAPANFAVGSSPTDIGVGDFDNDTNLDVITANRFAASGQRVSILPGNGDGTFDAKLDFAVGDTNAPRKVFVGDLNGDNDVDFVVANDEDDTPNLNVRLGDGVSGNFTFAAQVTYNADDSPNSITGADFDDDGDIDLATGNTDHNEADVMINNGDGTFQPFVAYPLANNPIGIVAEDLDKDGDIDLATSNDDGNTISVLLGDCSGTFAAEVTTAAANRPTAIIAANLNGANNPDLVITESSVSNHIQVFLSSGSGSGSGGGCGGGGGGPTHHRKNIPFVPPSVTVVVPNGGESFDAGTALDVQWNTTGRVDLVDVSYSADNGSTWTLLADNIQSSGTYRWTIPDVSTTRALLKVEATDTVVVYAADASDAAFTIVGTFTPTTPVPVPCGDGDDLSPGDGDPAAACVLEGDPGSRTNPRTVLLPDRYVRTNADTTVYYITSDLRRRAVLDARTFFTHEDSFGIVEYVTDAAISSAEQGWPLITNPSTVLLTFWDAPAVYAAVPNPANAERPILRRLDSEELAQAIFTSAWRDYVIDYNPAFETLFELGPPVTRVEPLLIDSAKSRDALSASAGIIVIESYDDASARNVKRRMKYWLQQLTDRLKSP